MYLNDFSLCVSYPVGLRWCHTTGDNQSTRDTVPQTTNQRTACCREGREEGREEGGGKEEGRRERGREKGERKGGGREEEGRRERGREKGERKTRSQENASLR